MQDIAYHYLASTPSPFYMFSNTTRARELRTALSRLPYT